MQPFDLQKAIDGAKLVTRDGREATDFKYFEAANSVGVVINEGLYIYNSSGRMSHASSLDLFIAPEENIEFLNLYKAPTVGARMSSTRHNSIESAKRDATCHAVCIVKVTTINQKTTAEIVHTY